MATEPILYFLVKFKDGTVRKIVVGDGEGYFREEHFKGAESEFTTYQVFVAKGVSKDIPSFTGKDNPWTSKTSQQSTKDQLG